MPVILTKHRSLKALADEIIADLRPSYDLIYISQGDELADSLKSKIASDDMDDFWETTDGDYLMEWESDCREESVRTIITDDAKDVVRRWEREDDADYADLLNEFDGSDEWDRVREEISDRDDGEWFRQLVDQSGSVLLRINVIDEDHGYAFQDVKPKRVLKDVGLPVTDDNKRIMRQMLAECSPEFSVLMGYWIVGANLDDLYDLPSGGDREIEIVNPYLYLGNPFTGSGWISEEPFQGVVTVKRSDMLTDKQAFGYSVNEVYGGLSPSSFECEIRFVPKWVPATSEYPETAKVRRVQVVLAARQQGQDCNGDESAMLKTIVKANAAVAQTKIEQIKVLFPAEYGEALAEQEADNHADDEGYKIDAARHY